MIIWRVPHSIYLIDILTFIPYHTHSRQENYSLSKGISFMVGQSFTLQLSQIYPFSYSKSGLSITVTKKSNKIVLKYCWQKRIVSVRREASVFVM